MGQVLSQRHYKSDLKNIPQSMRQAAVMIFVSTKEFQCKSKTRFCYECIVAGSRITNLTYTWHQQVSTCCTDPYKHHAQYSVVSPGTTRQYFYSPHVVARATYISCCYFVIGTGVATLLHCIRIVNNINNKRGLCVIQSNAQAH